MLARFGVAVLSLALSAGVAVADDACLKKDGMIPGPVVPNKEIAKQIYIAIAKGLYPKTWRRYPRIFVIDDGASWGVGQDTPPPPSKTYRDAKGELIETVTVSGGGGALEMDINKCDAGVVMHFSR
jgi:hypothetical protein